MKKHKSFTLKCQSHCQNNKIMYHYQYSSRVYSNVVPKIIVFNILFKSCVSLASRSFKRAYYWLMPPHYTHTPIGIDVFFWLNLSHISTILTTPNRNRWWELLLINHIQYVVGLYDDSQINSKHSTYDMTFFKVLRRTRATMEYGTLIKSSVYGFIYLYIHSNPPAVSYHKPPRFTF